MGRKTGILMAVMAAFLLAGCGGHQSEQIDLRKINAEKSLRRARVRGITRGLLLSFLKIKIRVKQMSLIEKMMRFQGKIHQRKKWGKEIQLMEKIR